MLPAGRGVTIETRWGYGYFLETESRDVIARALSDDPLTTEIIMTREVVTTSPAAAPATASEGVQSAFEGDLLSVAGGLIFCARTRQLPHHAKLLLDAASLVLDGARADLAGGAAEVDKPLPNPAGETIRSTPGERKEAVPKTGTSPVGTASTAHQSSPRKPAARSQALSYPATDAKPPASPSGPSEKGGGLVQAVGAAVVLEPGNESISYAGKEMELTSAQAKLADLLVRASPHPVDRAFLMTKLWGGPSENRDAALSARATELRNVIEVAIGLTVKTVRGIGISIGAIED